MSRQPQRPPSPQPMDNSTPSAGTTPTIFIPSISSKMARKRRLFGSSIPIVPPPPPVAPYSSKDWRQHMYPPVTSASAYRDAFGGHGIFEELQALVYVMALFGLLPVSFRPLRVSFHPLRSTLLHCVLVTALVSWSAYHLLTARLEHYLSESDPFETQSSFSSVVNFAHLSGLAMLPLLWFEARRLRTNEALCASLIAHFDYVRSRCCSARFVSFVTAVLSVVVAPFTVAVWMTVVSSEAVHWTHAFANHHIVQLELIVTSLTFCLFQSVRNFAKDLSRAMVQELSLPYPSPCRVVAFRRAWLTLRDVTEGLVLMPLTTICMMLFTLLMFTLNSYMGLVCLMDRRPALGALIFVIGLHFMLQLVIICDAVQRARDAVSKGFLQPLEHFCTLRSMDETASDEINHFREIVASSQVVVSAAGFWDIDRHSISSVMAASVGYLIVLIQFRSSPESAHHFRNNSTTAADAM